MFLQEIVAPWDQQPQEWADVDWGSPLASGLVSLLVDGASGTRSLIGALSGGSDVAGAPLTPTATAFGPAYRGASNLDWHAGPDMALANQAAITVIALVIRTGSGSQGFSGPFGVGDSSPTISLEANPDNYSGDGVFFSAWNSAGTRSNLFVASNAKLAPLNTPQVVAIRVANSTLAGFYDGRLLGSIAGPATLRTFGSLQKGRSQGIRFNGMVPFAACWNRGLSDAEIASISANPWQLFVRREWVSMAAASGNQTLTPALFTNSSTFYSAVVSQAGGAQSLTPSLYTNTSAFYPATVTPGAVSLAPSLFTNSGTFYSATVSLGGSPQTLTPALFTNPQSFFAPTVSPGAVNLAPALFTNAQTFYAPVVTNGVTLAPPLLTNSQTFYGASITLGPAVLRPALLANVNQFYTHALTGGVVRIKQKGLRKTRYTPGRVPSDAKELARFIQNELERLTDALESPFTHQLLEVLHAEPTRKPTGSAMVAFADGTDWNPGAGRGLYLYDPQTAAWTKIS